MTQQEIFNRIRQWFKDDDWHTMEKNGHIFELSVTLKCALGSVRVFVDVREGFYLNYVVLPVIGKNNIVEVQRFLTMANFGLINGNFELDLRDGEIRYKTFVNCTELSSLPSRIVHDSVVQALLTVQKYGDSIARLCLFPNDSSAQKEMEICEPRQSVSLPNGDKASVP